MDENERERLAELCRRFRINTGAMSAYMRHHDPDLAEAVAFRERLQRMGVYVSLERARDELARQKGADDAPLG